MYTSLDSLQEPVDYATLRSVLRLADSVSMDIAPLLALAHLSLGEAVTRDGRVLLPQHAPDLPSSLTRLANLMPPVLWSVSCCTLLSRFGRGVP